MKILVTRFCIIGLLSLWALTINAQAPTISYTSPQTFSVGTPVSLSPTITIGGAPLSNTTYTTGTFAGSSAGYVDGTGTSAKFNEPTGVAIDAAGNMYIADLANNVIRKITPAGVVSTLAGSGTAGSANGQGVAASFNGPEGVAVDAAGNVYVADRSNNLIRKITPWGLVSTFAGSGSAGSADGAGAAASFHLPGGIAIDAAGNLYIGDYGNNKVRKITPGGVVSTFAGTGATGSANGPGSSATFNQPLGLAVDPAGNVYVADWHNNLIRVISPAGVVSTLAGSGTAGSSDGTGAYASFNFPTGVALDASGNLYVADEQNNKIRKVNIQYAYVNTIAGTGAAGGANGVGGLATFNNPFGIAIDSTGFVTVGDFSNNRVRQVAVAPVTVAPHLPAGLGLGTTTGLISGTPLAASVSTAYTITAYNNYGTGTAALNITVNNAPAGSQGQSLNQNYVLTNSPRIAGLVNDSTLAIAFGNPVNLQTGIQYVDGLGRPVQTLQVQASPLGYDMVQPQAYDRYGREITKYLPYTPQTGTAGSYRINAVSTDQNTFYASPPTGANVTAIAYPIAQTNFDNSPLNRPVEQGAPGVSWQLGTAGIPGGEHTVKMVYTVNNATSFGTDSVNGRQVAMYYTTIGSDLSQTLVANGYYPAGTLTATIARDENWVSGRAGIVEEYKDIDGHVVLKRQYNYTGGVLQVLSTYYVYDDLGRLAFVLPPAMGADGALTFTTTQLNNLGYQYQYDGLGRMVQKKLPGKAWDYMVYNNMDQLVATEDGNQRSNTQWIITKYDALGRVILTEIWNDGGTLIGRPSLQSVVNGLTGNLWESPTTTGNGYTNAVFPTTNIIATLSVNYYDGYTAPGLPTAYSAPTGANLATRGQPTATLTNVLGSSDMLWKVNYYDNWGRAMENYGQHYLGGTLNAGNYDAITTTYSFTNQPTTITRKHWTSASTTNPLVTIFNKYIYDNANRKVKTWEKLTNSNLTADTLRLVSQSNYNEIGQLYAKQLHSKDSTNFMQTVAYTYNERGWLLSSSAPLFAMQLYYNTGANKQYNGNIAYQYWGTPGNLSNNYTYTYDKLNRLTGGVTALDNYQESGITYDLVGNITSLNRYQAGTQIDQLSYTYSGTYQLFGLNDATSNNAGLPAGTTTYSYDNNGNMLTATNTVNTGGNKSFTYNLLNLPLVATVPNGTITYTYDITGNKLRKVSVIGGVTKTTDYVNGIEYDNSTTTIGFIQTEEGKAVPYTTTNYDYTYYLGDNLGNTRITFDTKNGIANTLQQDDYYPFGLEINRSVTNPKNEYLYNKKELQEEFTEYDYGARFYDPVIGRWTTIDPMAEKNRRFTSYAHGKDNPIRFVDPDGMKEVDINGDKADEATKQLQSKSSLKITRDESTGKLSATGKAKTDADKKLLAAINDTKIKVKVNATSSNFTTNNTPILGGTYGGSNINTSEVNNEGNVVTSQTVNPDQTAKMDSFYGEKSGTTMTHEIIESFLGGQNSAGTPAPVPGVDLDVNGAAITPVGQAYLNAHNGAMAADPTYVAPTIVQDPNSQKFYILQHPIGSVPDRQNNYILLNDLSRSQQ